MTFWGLTDRLNWRATHNPQLFNSDWSEKLAAVAVADPEAWLGVDELDIETTVRARCVVGRVVQGATVRNGADVPVSGTVSSPYGQRDITLGAGKTSSVAFTSRLTSVPAGTLVVSAHAGDDTTTQEVAFAASACS